MTKFSAPHSDTATDAESEAAARAFGARRHAHLSLTSPPSAGLDQIARRLPTHAYAFCDWLTFRAQLAQPVAPLNAGRILAIDIYGRTEWQAERRLQVTASHQTTVQLRCDGDILELSGNLGRLGRPDNVLGAPVQHCLRIAEAVCAYHAGIDLTGAAITLSRVDVTTMLQAHTPDRRALVLRALAPRRAGRYLRATRHASGALTWASTRQRITVYDKAAELRHHAKRVEPDPELLAELELGGTIRLEAQLRAEHLRRYGLRYPDAWPCGAEGKPLAAIMEQLQMNEPITDQSRPKLHARELGIWHAWRSGMLTWQKLEADYSRPTAYRIRKAIREETGEDIRQEPPPDAVRPAPSEAVALEQWLPPEAYRFESPYLSAEGNARMTRIIHTAPQPFRRRGD